MRIQRLMIVSAAVAALAVSGCGFSGASSRNLGASIGGTYSGKPIEPPSTVTGLPTVNLETVKATFTQSVDPSGLKYGMATTGAKIEANPEWSVKPADSVFGKIVQMKADGASAPSVDAVLSSPSAFKPAEPLNFSAWNKGFIIGPGVTDRGMRFSVTLTNNSVAAADISKFKLEGIARAKNRFCRWLSGGLFTDEQILGYPTMDDGISQLMSLDPSKSVTFDAALACAIPKGTDVEVDMKLAQGKNIKPRIYRTLMP